MKILIVGASTVWLEFLAYSFKKDNENIVVDATEISIIKPTEIKYVDNVIKSPFEKKGFIRARSGNVFVTLNGEIEVPQGFDFKSAEQYVLEHSMINMIKSRGYTHISLQYVRERHYFLAHLPSEIKIVTSFCGSDLLRTGYRIGIHHLLKRASKITLQRPFMKEILGFIYGHELKHKVNYVLYGSDNRHFDLVDELNINPDKDKIKGIIYKWMNIPNERCLIQIGHNSSPANQHDDIVLQIKKLPKEIKDSIALILPATYGGATINLEGLNDVPYYILDRYLSIDELVLLRSCINIYIHLPISDALSGTLMELVYSGASIITGKWLFYSHLDEVDASYLDINCLEELPSAVERIVSSRGLDLKSPNRELIKSKYSNEGASKTWFKIFD